MKELLRAFDLGLLKSSEHFTIRRQPDGRMSVLLNPKIKKKKKKDVVCPDVELVCDAIHASLTKCGFSPLPADDGNFYAEANYAGGGPNLGLEEPSGVGPMLDESLFYLKLTETDRGTTHPQDHLNSGCDPNAYGATHSGTLTQVVEFDPIACAAHLTSCSGSVITTVHINPGDYGEGGAPYTATYTYDCNGERCVDDGPNTGCQSYPFGAHPICQGWEGIIKLETEYTTDMLKANVLSVLPAYPGTWNGSNSSYVDLSDDESSYTVRRFKPKFLFSSPLPAGAVLTYYEQGVTEVERTWTAAGGETEYVGDEVLEPAENGSITVETFSLQCP